MTNTYKEKVWTTIQRVPKGKVTTYGEIGKKLSMSPRVVGYALHQNKSSEVPCHRVVNRQGRIAPNFGMGGKEEHRKRLIAEGIGFKDLMHVDLKNHFFSLR